MMDERDGVRAHYNATGLTERLKALFGADGPPLKPEALAAVDQFHTRGLAATAELAELAGIAPAMHVLDVGAGIGGPARFLATSCGCQVTGVDLSEPFVEAARFLSERTGLSGQVSFETADALDLPFADTAFDVVLLQHVAMNIADRAGLYREIRRVVKAGGRFAMFDVVATERDVIYPAPWARTPDTSFLLAPPATRDAIEGAGFKALAWSDDTEAARAWAESVRAAGPPAGPNLGVVMGPGFVDLSANHVRNLLEGRIAVVTGVFEAV